MLQGEVDVDVCIIGGGFMGLSTALHLRREGMSVVVLEAAEIGWGASGRNNGLVAPGLKRDPWQVRRKLGVETGDRLLRLSATAPAVVFDLIERHNIDCDTNRDGWIQAAHSKRALRSVERRAAAWQELGEDVAMIPGDDVDAELGTSIYSGACRYADGGSINPLAFVHGLAQAAISAGADIHENSPAIDISKSGDRWIATSVAGRVTSDRVVACTNAYNHNIERLRGSVLPLRTAQVASHPLPADFAGKILPGAAAASDTQRLLTSFRLTADRRLIMGGASATAGDEHAGLMRHLHDAARTRFPGFPVPWEYGWSGYLALTPDHLPQIVRSPDGFFAGVGCNGRGIAMATAMGACLTELICGQDKMDCSVPVREPKSYFGYGMRHVGVGMGVMINRFLDTAERRIMS